MTEPLTLSHLAATALRWAAEQYLPFSACECWIGRASLEAEGDIHLRFYDYRDGHPPPPAVGVDWARAWDADLEGRHVMRQITVPQSIRELSIDEIRGRVLAEYIDGLKGIIPLPNG